MIRKKDLNKALHVFLDDLMLRGDLMDYHKINAPGTMDLEEVIVKWCEERKIEVV